MPPRNHNIRQNSILTKPLFMKKGGILMLKKMISTSLAMMLMMSSMTAYADTTTPVSPVTLETPAAPLVTTPVLSVTPPATSVIPPAPVVTSPAPIVIVPAPIVTPPIIEAPGVVTPNDIQRENIKKEIQRLLSQLESLRKKANEDVKKPQMPKENKGKLPIANNSFNTTSNSNNTVNSNNASTNNINIVNNFNITNNGTQSLVFNQNQLGQLNAMLQQNPNAQQKDPKVGNADIQQMIKSLEQKIAKLYEQIKEEIKVLPVDLLVIDKESVKVDANMILKGDTAFMPVALFEKSFDVKVMVDEKKKRVIILSDEGIAELSLAESKMVFNGKEMKTNAKPFLMKEKLMIPVNQLAKVYSVKMHYQNETNTLFLNDLDVPNNK